MNNGGGLVCARRASCCCGPGWRVIIHPHTSDSSSLTEGERSRTENPTPAKRFQRKNGGEARLRTHAGGSSGVVTATEDCEMIYGLSTNSRAGQKSDASGRSDAMKASHDALMRGSGTSPDARRPAGGRVSKEPASPPLCRSTQTTHLIGSSSKPRQSH